MWDVGVSIDETLLTIVRCCYCGYENELVKCERCGEMVNVDVHEHGLCPSCAAYIDKQYIKQEPQTINTLVVWDFCFCRIYFLSRA